ncbi:MAG: hypothetical protein WBD10_09905, partial [Acidobacteriaceae bacterium]
MRNFTPQWLCLLLTASAISMLTFAATANAQGPYHVATQWKIGGDSGWDYMAVNPSGKLLYIAHGDHVVAI